MIHEDPTDKVIMFYEIDIFTGKDLALLPLGFYTISGVTLEREDMQKCRVRDEDTTLLRKNKQIRLEQLAPGLFVYQPGDMTRYVWFIARQKDSLFYAHRNIGLTSVGIVDIENMYREAAEFEYNEKNSHEILRASRSIWQFVKQNLYYDFKGNEIEMNPWTVYQFARLCKELSFI